jgi:hypothetical protein
MGAGQSLPIYDTDNMSEKGNSGANNYKELIKITNEETEIKETEKVVKPKNRPLRCKSADSMHIITGQPSMDYIDIVNQDIDIVNQDIDIVNQDIDIVNQDIDIVNQDIGVVNQDIDNEDVKNDKDKKPYKPNSTVWPLRAPRNNSIPQYSFVSNTNSGWGSATDNELYLRKAGVKLMTTQNGTLHFTNGLTLISSGGFSSNFNHYEKGVIALDTDAISAIPLQQTVVTFIRVGELVTLQFPAFEGIIQNTTQLRFNLLPARLTPLDEMTSHCLVNPGGNTYYDDGVFKIRPSGLIEIGTSYKVDGSVGGFLNINNVGGYAPFSVTFTYSPH